MANISKLSYFTVAACLFFAFYLILTIPSGEWGLWSLEELITGSFLAIVAALVATPFLFQEKKDLRMLNPLRWLFFFIYAIGPFFWSMLKANLDVAYRVITGRINPGIVEVETDLDNDLGLTLLANSITLTPGTLSVEVDEEKRSLYVHWINVIDEEPEAEEVCASFPRWSRRITQ